MKVRLAPHFRKFENKKRLIFKIVCVSAHHKLLTTSQRDLPQGDGRTMCAPTEHHNFSLLIPNYPWSLYTASISLSTSVKCSSMEQ